MRSYFVVGLSAIIGCGGNAESSGAGSSGNSGCPKGAERCECAVNKTCDAGLVCASNLCVSVGDLTFGGSGGVAPLNSAGSAAVSSGGSGGMSTSAGGVAGAAGCPALACTANCTLGFWTNLDGCDSCACIPPESRMTYANRSCPTESITLEAAVSRELGAVARWVFDFKWTCSVVQSGAPKAASVQVAVVDMATRSIGSENLMIVYPLDPASPPTEFRPATIVVAAGVMPDSPLTLDVSSGTYLTIRREGDRFVGGLLLAGTVNISPSQYPGQFAGSFDVPVPR